jgi:muramoyltetrapeptide carboxypeptidase
MTSRRTLLASGLSLPLLNAAAPDLVKPKALKRGDTVGLITPSTYVSDPERLMQAERLVNYLGLKPKFGKNVRRRAGYLGGSIQERLDDLHAMFADAEVKAVFAIRGGYGSAQLLDRIDYDLIRRNPKIFVGYSDITALHLAIHLRTGLVTFHGPVALSRFNDYTLRHFQQALFSTRALGELKNPPEANPIVWGTRCAPCTRARPRAR